MQTQWPGIQGKRKSRWKRAASVREAIGENRDWMVHVQLRGQLLLNSSNTYVWAGRIRKGSYLLDSQWKRANQPICALNPYSEDTRDAQFFCRDNISRCKFLNISSSIERNLFYFLRFLLFPSLVLTMLWLFHNWFSDR